MWHRCKVCIDQPRRTPWGGLRPQDSRLDKLLLLPGRTAILKLAREAQAADERLAQQPPPPRQVPGRLSWMIFNNRLNGG